MMDKYRKYLRYFLPALFTAYLGCLIAFTHVHIVGGVTLVHAHPYHKTADGRPGPEHTLTFFQLLHQLSVLQSVAADGGIDLSDLFLTPFADITARKVSAHHLRPLFDGLSPRAPPRF